MLKPFRIRELLNTAEVPAPRQNDGGQGVQNIHDGVVRVTSSQYDETVSSNPEARLSYIDEDDGESIMVGSSLELAQRLDEPVPEWLLSAPPPDRALPTDSDPAPMHIFDIRRSPDIMDTWRNIHAQSEFRPILSGAARAFVGPSDDTGHISNAGVLSPDPSSEAIYVQSSDLADARKRWVQHCNPPQLHISVPAPEAGHQAENDRPVTDIANNEHDNDGIKPEDKAECITEEGKRQAKAAGAKLRGSRNLLTDEKPSSSSLPSPTFWSTYLQGERGFNSGPDEASTREPKTNESPIDDDSLFNVFEAELAKLMSESAPNTEQPPDAETPPQNDTQQAEPDSPRQDSTRDSTTGPGEIAALTMHTLLRGIAHITSDLRTRLPEVERRLASLQQQVPSQVESKVNTALQGMKGHVQTLANVMQDTARSTRDAAERSRDSEVLASAQVDALRNLAHDLGEMGKTLFAAFESRVAAGMGVENTQPGQGLSTTATPSNNNQDESSTKEQMDESKPTCPESGLSGDASRPSSESTLWILSISRDATEEMICDALAAQGFIGKVTLHKLMPNGRKDNPHPGYGEIRFPSSYAALGAFQALKDTKLCDKPLTLLAPRHPVTGSSLLSTTQPNADTAAEGRIRSFGRYRSTLKTSRGPRETPRQKLSVNFDTSTEPSKDTANLRRAKSLSTLLAERNALRAGLGRPQAAPHVPPKEPHSCGDEGRREKEMRAICKASPTLMDDDNTSAEFSARYPPMSTLLGPAGPPVNNQRRINLDEAQDIPRILTDTLPGAFPSDIPEQRDTVPEPPSYPSISNLWNTAQAPHPTSFGNPTTSIRRSATERHSTRRAPWEAAFEAGLGSRRRRDHRSVSMANTPGSFPVGSRSNGSIPSYTETRRQPEMAENNSNSGIDLCVGHLQALGFADGDMMRLKIYAEAANGNLGDAIEMIEEERRVLEQHGSALP